MTFYDKYFIKKQLKAYVISLNEPKLLFNILENQNMIPLLIDSVNPKTLTEEIKNENTSYYFSEFGSNDSIANGMSHIKAWKKILESKDPYGIVFEDDISLTDNFYDNLTIHLKNLPKDFDIFYLGCLGCQDNINPLNIIFNCVGLGNFEFIKINNYINQPSIALGSYAYVISRNGIRKILKLLEGNIFYNIDFCLQILFKNNKIIVYSPNIRLAYRESSNKEISYNSEINTPIILNKALSNFYIDNKCKLSYISTFTLLQIENYPFTVSSILFILLGFYLGNYDYNIYEISLFYLILSIPDLTNINNISIKMNYLLFIISFLISEKLNSINN